MVKECKEALEKHSKYLQDAFKLLREQINVSANLVKEFRNCIGGHVKHARLAEALNDIGFERKGLIHVGERTGTTHYRFTGDLILAMMLPGIAVDNLIPALEDILSNTAKLIKVIGTTDAVINAYIEDRKLYR